MSQRTVSIVTVAQGDGEQKCSDTLHNRVSRDRITIRYSVNGYRLA